MIDREPGRSSPAAARCIDLFRGRLCAAVRCRQMQRARTLTPAFGPGR